MGESSGEVSRQPLTLRLDFHLHVIPYFVYIAHFKNSLVEVLCLWKNLCSRKNQERKKVLGKKKKKKKQAQRRKKEYHSVKKRKIFFVKETCNDEAPRTQRIAVQPNFAIQNSHLFIVHYQPKPIFCKNIPGDDIDKHQNKTYWLNVHHR